MSIGLMVRKVLGKNFFVVLKYYRRIFVDLEKVAAQLAAIIPSDAHVLDVGGGDGAVLNHLLLLREDIRITLIDISENIGSAIQDDLLPRITLLPGVSMEDYTASCKNDETRPACLIMSDVMHHIESRERMRFLHDIRSYILGVKDREPLLIIKDIEPGYVVSVLSYLSDRCITGDKNVSLIAKKELRELANTVFENKIDIKETALLAENKPNYMLIIRLDT